MNKGNQSEVEVTRRGLAERLKSSREYLGFSQGQVADALGIRRPSISEIEAGVRRVEATELSAFAKLYGCTIEFLLNGEQPESVQAGSNVEFLARATQGLSDKDILELAKFADFLRNS